MAFSVIGICMLFFCALYMCRISGAYFERLDDEYREMLSFLYTIKQKMSTSGQKLSVIISNLSDSPQLSKSGFLVDAINSGLYRAFEVNKHKFIIKSEDKKLLSNYFSDAGKGMLAAELENIENCTNEFEKRYEKIKAELPSKKKVHNTVIICTVLLCIILIV